MTTQIVEIAGQKMAMLPVADYERLVDIAEDKADVMEAIQAEKRRLEGEEYLPATLADQIMDGENPLKVWRNYRGLTMAELAKLADCSQSMLSQIESGSRQGKAALWRSLANALNVSVDDILPID